MPALSKASRPCRDGAEGRGDRFRRPEAGVTRPDGKRALVRHRDQTPSAACPYGEACRIVTGGEGGVANVHVITVTEGGLHVHRQYDEVYYVLSGTGTVTIADEEHPLRPGTVVVLPAGTPHALRAAPGTRLEFVIFGTPPMSIDDPRARPERPSSTRASSETGP